MSIHKNIESLVLSDRAEEAGNLAEAIRLRVAALDWPGTGPLVTTSHQGWLWSLWRRGWSEGFILVRSQGDHNWDRYCYQLDEEQEEQGTWDQDGAPPEDVLQAFAELLTSSCLEMLRRRRRQT